MKRKANYGDLSVEKTLLGLPDMVKAASETWTNPRVSSFQGEPCWEIDVMPHVVSHSPVMVRLKLDS